MLRAVLLLALRGRKASPMDQFISTLFNTNHEAPSLGVIVVLAVIAIVVPAIHRYMLARRQANPGRKKQDSQNKKK